MSPKNFEFRKSIFKVWLKLDWYQLRYSIEFKPGQMLHGQILIGQIFPRQLTTNTDGLIELDKIGLVSAEIFHYIQTRTNVAFTNVDVTNVPKTVDNSCRWPNHPTFKVWLSYEQ